MMIPDEENEKETQPSAATTSLVAAAMPPALDEPALADPATAALNAGRPPEQADDATPEAEQEDPYAGRNLPGEEDEEAMEAADDESEKDFPQTAGTAQDAEEDGAAAELPASPGAAMPKVLPPAPKGKRAAGDVDSPAAPSPARQQESRFSSIPSPEVQRYWRQVLTGSADTVPDSVRQRAGVDDPGLTEEQRDYRLLSTINRSWAVDNLGVSREQVRSGWAQLRSQLAERFNVADDEQELFAALSIEAQDSPRREAVKTLYEKHYRAGLLGQDAPGAENTPGEPEADPLPYAEGLAEEARRKGAAIRRRFLPLAAELAEGLNVYAGMEQDAFAAPRVLAAVPELARAVEGLAELEPRERQHVYAIAQAMLRQQQPEGGESLYRTMLRASRRGATGLGIGVGQAVANASVATLNSLGGMLGGVLGEDYGRPLREAATGLDLRARIVEETRRLLQEEVAPLDVSAEAGFAGRLLVDAAGATPAAIVACSGGAGFAAMGVSGMGEAVAAARQRAPEGQQWLQYLAGVLGGGIQAAIYSGMSRVGGQLLSNSISRFSRIRGTGTGDYRLASLGVLGAMGFEEAKLLFASKAAEAASLGTQELAARLERTASNIDWNEFGDNAQDLELNMREAAMNLPFILIASGRVALRHFRSSRSVLGEGQALLDWGISEQTRDAIMKERNIDRQSELLRDALRSSKRWSAPGFLAEAARALRLLNTDYYQGFKDPQAVVDFLRLPAENSLMPRPPFVAYSAENPAHVQELMARHGKGEKVNENRLGLALQLWDEWWQKAHIVKPAEAAAAGPGGQGNAASAAPALPTGPGGDMLPTGQGNALMPTAARRTHFGLELLRMDSMIPPRMRPGGFYAPRAEAERNAMLRDRFAELHDLGYQMLLISYPLDALTRNPRGLKQLRQATEKARLGMHESVGRTVMRLVTGTPEAEAMEELSKSITSYFMHRRYGSYPPAWMQKVEAVFTNNLVEAAHTTVAKDMPEAAPELLDAFRVALGFKSCAKAIYELLPTTPDFQTALSRGMSPAQAYIHLLSRELGVDIGKAKHVPEMLASMGANNTDLQAYHRQHAGHVELYRRFSGIDFESAPGADGKTFWRLRRPNGQYTRWHGSKEEVINDLAANAAFTFMPYHEDRMTPLRNPEPGKDFDLMEGRTASPWQFTGFDHLCRVALRDSVRGWVESAPYAQPGFALREVRRGLYLGGRDFSSEVYMREDPDNTVMVDKHSLSTPLHLMRSRFYTHWWRVLSSQIINSVEAGEELMRLGVMSPEEYQRVLDIAKPPVKTRRKDVPLKLTPLPNYFARRQAMARALTEFSLHYSLARLDDMPLPPSAREWFRLAALCPLSPGKPPRQARRLSLSRPAHEQAYTCWANRHAAQQLQAMIPAVEEMSRKLAQGQYADSPLLQETLNAAGLNRVLNMEQAWVMRSFPTPIIQAIEHPFWCLFEKPVDAWSELSGDERYDLSNHLKAIARTETDPEAMEAEARGEKPDYVESAIQNLDDVLRDYPELHRYDLVLESPIPRVQRLTLDKLYPGAEAALAEPEYEMLPRFTSNIRRGYTLHPPEELPEFLKDDSRVLPAMHLLAALRNYPSNRPFSWYRGIEWNGAVFGGINGRRPKGLGADWLVSEPLEGLVDMLRRVEALNQSLPEGENLRVFDLPLEGLDDQLDMSPMRNVTLYRSPTNPAHLYRLMPGEADAANPLACQPYVTRSIGGTYYRQNRALRKPEEMYHAYVPLPRFRTHNVLFMLEETRRKLNKKMLDYTLSGVLSSTMRMASQNNPKGAIAGMREWLLRFAEDSGFSESLRKLDPRELTYGQVLTLRLAREMLLCVCGTEPAEAYRRFIRMCHRIRRSDSMRGAVLRAITSSSEGQYSQGEPLFADKKPGFLNRPRKKRTRKRKSPKLYNKIMSAEDLSSLDSWMKEQDRRELENTFRMMDGYNDDVRDDGYSRGFFDD